MLETRAEITNPPRPGPSFERNRYITSIQVNCSHPNRQVTRTAGAPYRHANTETVHLDLQGRRTWRGCARCVKEQTYRTPERVGSQHPVVLLTGEGMSS